ncbi:MAG TPA: dephospho-CoA kinase [Miltoncostaeaceae bacterium]|nr:dephospho-CoA kinase [Miltoncostaeaceae bacterium]
MAGGRPPAPPVLGLTGGIGSGKSEALRAFAELGAATLSSDDAVHAAYARPEVVERVRARFGDAVVGADGSVDRALLGPRAFAEEGGLAALEAIVHPLVGQAREEWIAAQAGAEPPPPLLVCEVPLLYEVGLADLFDAVLVVTASDDVRRARVEARGQDFAARAAHQMPEADKLARADAHYVNDGDRDALRGWVADRYAEYAGPSPHGPPVRH